MRYTVFIAILLVLFGCTPKSKVEEQSSSKSLPQPEKSESVSTDLSQPEDFKTFYTKFLQDEHFQLSRINFPLDGEIVEDVLETSPIQKTDWKMVRISVYEIDRNEYKVEIEEDSTHVHHRIYVEDSGIDIDLKYKQIEGKWYLVYYKSIFI